MTGCGVLCCGVLSFDSCLREIHLEPVGIDYHVVRSEFGCRWTRFDATCTRDVPCRGLEWRFGFQVNFTKPEACCAKEGPCRRESPWRRGEPTAKRRDRCAKEGLWRKGCLSVNYFQIETYRPESVIARNHCAHRLFHPSVKKVAFSGGQVFNKFTHRAPGRFA